MCPPFTLSNYVCLISVHKLMNGKLNSFYGYNEVDFKGKSKIKSIASTRNISVPFSNRSFYVQTKKFGFVAI